MKRQRAARPLLILPTLLAVALPAGAQIARTVRPETEADYLLDVRGANVVALHGATGEVVSKDPDAGVVLNAVLADLPARGGLVFLKGGTYPLSTRVDIDDQNGVTLQGAGMAVIEPTGTALLIDGSSTDVTIRGLVFRNGTDKGINIKRGVNVRILDCVFEDIESSAIQGHIGSDPSDPLQNLWIRGCRFTRCDKGNSGTSSRGAVYLYYTQDLVFSENVVESSGSCGVTVSRASERILIADNIIRDSDQNVVSGQGHGLYIAGGDGDSKHVVVSGNLLLDNGGNGMEVASGSDDKGSRFLVADNVCTGNGFNNGGSTTGWRNGIYVIGTDHVLSGNLCAGNYGDGIKVGYGDESADLVIADNVIADNGQGMSGTGGWASGIALMSPSDGIARDQRILIQGNLVRDDTGYQLHAIHGRDGVDGVLVRHNLVAGVATPLIDFDATVTRVHVEGNRGFATEARGEVAVIGDSSIDPSDDYVEVAHGLALTPAVAGFRVTPTSSLGGRSFWLDAVDATVFRIYVEDDGGNDGEVFTFAWDYRQH